LNGSDEGSRIFSIPSSDAAPPLEVKESVLDQVTQLIKVFVIPSLFFAVFPWRYNGLHVLRNSLIDNFVAIVPFVSE